MSATTQEVITADCWEWKGTRDDFGYGIKSIKNKLCRTHRLAYEWTNGPIPYGVCVLHRCDNPPCCNPDHLFLGTRPDNSADMARKGRGRKPVSHCQKGHPLSGSNRVFTGGKDRCRKCQKLGWQEYFRRNKTRIYARRAAKARKDNSQEIIQ